jgi:hypothetical protein
MEHVFNLSSGLIILSGEAMAYAMEAILGFGPNQN